MKIKDIFSPNYNKKERSKKSIKIIVIHYTGMQSERESLNRLCDFRSRVSCHYVINRKGKIYRLVNEKNTAWHAGKSCWSNYKNLNRYSIGIELVNKGHKFGYSNYTSKQISQLLVLCHRIIKKYNIPKNNIVGHSDIAPRRKNDPGEKFPWKVLSENKIGLWHNLNPNLLRKFRKNKVTKKEDKMKFIKDVNSIGYCIRSFDSQFFFKKIVCAFQRHYRKELVNGILDEECLIIASNLSKKS